MSLFLAPSLQSRSVGSGLAKDGGREARKDPCPLSHLSYTGTAYVKPVLQVRRTLVHLAEDIMKERFEWKKKLLFLKHFI